MTLPLKPQDPPIVFGNTGDSVIQIQNFLSSLPSVIKQIDLLKDFNKGFSFSDAQHKGKFEKDTRLFVAGYQKTNRFRIRNIGKYTEEQFQNIIGQVDWATWAIMREDQKKTYSKPVQDVTKKQPPTTKEEQQKNIEPIKQPFSEPLSDEDLFGNEETDQDIVAAQESSKIKPAKSNSTIKEKQSVDQTGLSIDSRTSLSEANPKFKTDVSGIQQDKIPEGIPKYISSPSERVISGENNAHVIIGRDRPRDRSSGYGGKGDTQAANIDLVVGLQGSEAKQVNSNNEQLWADKDFEKDAARVYLSQKADIDDYFDLPEGKIGSAKTRSAAGIKADAVRLIGREGVKIVASGDIKNSQGGLIASSKGVDLIAGNDEIQPITKGDNMVEAMNRMVYHVDKLAGIVDSMVMINSEFANVLATHYHYSPFFAAPTTPSETVMQQGVKHQIDMLTRVKKSIVALKSNLASFKVTYLNPVGKKYISSRKNHTS